MAEQTAFPFFVNETKLKEFLTRFCAIEDEQDRLREEIRVLKQDYAAAFPLRGTLAAIKIVRTRRKLADHPKEAMAREHLEGLEALVEAHLEALAEEMRVVPDMTTVHTRGTRDD